MRSRLLAAGLAVFVGGCRARPADPPSVLRLVDAFTSESVQGRVAAVAKPGRAPWRFDAPAPPNATPTRGFVAGLDVAGLVVREGRLEGRTTGDIPLLSVERRPEADEGDQLHAVEIRMRASAGTAVSMISVPQAPDFPAIQDRARALPWRLSAPLTVGEDFQSYTLTPTSPLTLAAMRHLVIRPTDVAGATFAIESVRLVTRREHLAGLPSGVGWQGLRDVYRESLVARPAETLRFPLVLPRGARLTLAVGTIEPEPLTFRVTVSPRRGPSEVVLERTLSPPFQWEEPGPLELSRFAGRPVTLSLTLEGGRPDAVGLWGSPVVRGLQATASKAPRKPRGVIVVQADTLRRDALDLYGYGRETAPRIRSLAAEGALFRGAVSQAPWTKVSTPSILTSLYPTTHGVHHFGDRLPASAETLAEVYRAAGYATLQLSSNSFTGFFTGLHQGFEEMHEDGSLATRATPYPSKTAREYVDRLAAWLERHGDAPFFVFLHLNDPHPPYEPRSPYDHTFAAPSASEVFKREMKALESHIANPAFKRLGMATRAEVVAAGLDPAGYVGRARDFYDGSIRGLDAEMGRLLERIRAQGLDQDTLLVFLSDHGHELQDHGAMWHGHSLYHELIDVPLFFRWPHGLAGGAVVDERVQLIDVMPTVLELSGVRAPAGVQGRSLAALLRRPSGALAVARAAEAPPAISERAAPSGIDRDPAVRESAAILSGDYKLIHNRARRAGVPEFELYDLAADPREQTNLAAGKPEVVARLARVLEAWHKSALQARLKPDSEAAGSMSPEQLERLRALGYIK